MKKARTSKKHVLARLIIPLALLLVWFGVGAIGGPYFGKIEEVSTNDMATFLPKSADSTKVNDELKKFTDSNTIPAVVVFESDKKLSHDQKAEISDAHDALVDSKLASGSISDPIYSDDKKAGFFAVPIDSDSEFATLIPKLQKIVENKTDSVNVTFTGPALFSKELDKAFAGIDGVLLFVALGVVFFILLVVYRSILLPIVTLAGATLALAAAIFVIWHLAKADIVLLNGQTQGILFILVIGAATDYALLYISRYREELMHGDSPLKATKTTLKASFEPIIAAGGTVTLGLICLLASDLGSNKALGPVGGIGIIFSIISALTFLPAVLLLLGKYAFWPRVPKSSTKKRVDYRANHRMWAKVGSLVGKHPRRIWVGTFLLLGAACLMIPQLDAEGVSQDNLVIGSSEARDGQKILQRHFPAGSGSPTFVLTPKDDKADVVKLLDHESSIDSVSIITTDDDKSSIPIGAAKREVMKDIRKTVTEKRKDQLKIIRKQIEVQTVGAPQAIIDQAYETAKAKVPSVNELTKKANPFKDIESKTVDNFVMLQATLDKPASSVPARETVKQLRDDLQKTSPDAKIGGTSAIQLDTNEASARDVKVVIPLILLAVTIVLMLLLRALVAPILLLLTTILSFGATIGIAAFSFKHIFNFAGADPVVVIFGFVFLVALGIDYNIFLMTRVREETARNGVREGTLKALVVTGGVITSAGIVLASTFAALNVIPILFLAQISFIVAFGVLLDTLVVRSLLVPALTLEIGKAMWWPSKLFKKGKK